MLADERKKEKKICVGKEVGYKIRRTTYQNTEGIIMKERRKKLEMDEKWSLHEQAEGKRVGVSEMVTEG